MASALAFGLGATEEPVVWVFFSPESPDAAPLIRRLKGRRIRPVLLTEDYFGSPRMSPPFLSTLRAAGEVRVVDPEGLEEAERLGIRELPAVAVRRGNHVCLAFGDRIEIQEVLRCSR